MESLFKNIKRLVRLLHYTDWGIDEWIAPIVVDIDALYVTKYIQPRETKNYFVEGFPVIQKVKEVVISFLRGRKTVIFIWSVTGITNHSFFGD